MIYATAQTCCFLVNVPWLFIRSYLKKVFWSNLGVGSSLQVLDPPEADLRVEARIRLDLEPKSFF